jgi:hypothetical protein
LDASANTQICFSLSKRINIRQAVSTIGQQ